MKGQTSTEMVVLSKIEKTPYSISVIVKSAVESIVKSMLNGGEYPELVLAKLGKKLYPVGHLDTLEAAKKAKLKSVTCMVRDVISMGDVAELHLAYNKSRTYNPISLIGFVEKIAKSGADLSMIPREYRAIHKYPLQDVVKKKIDSFVKEMAGCRNDVPSILHIILPLSKIKSVEQSDAIDIIIKYTKFKDRYIPPDRVALNSILSQFTQSGNVYSSNKTFPKDDNSGNIENASSTEKSSPSKKPSKVHAESNVLEYTCKCKQKLYINLTSGTVRQMVDGGSSINAVDMGGETLYSISRKDAEHLDVDVGVVINTYRISGKSGNAVIATKAKISKKKQAEIIKILQE